MTRRWTAVADGAAGRRRSAVDFRSRLIFGSLIAIGAASFCSPLYWRNGRWRWVRRNISTLNNGFAIACLGSMMAQNPLKSFLAALIDSWPCDRRRRRQHRGLSLYLLTAFCIFSDGVRFIVVVIGSLFSIHQKCAMLEHTSSGQKQWSAKRIRIFVQPERRRAVLSAPPLRSSVIGFLSAYCPAPGRPSPAPLPI